MKKILYIHGLDSYPHEERLEWLQSAGHQVWALHLNYRKQPDAFYLLENVIDNEGINFLVGSSLGGRLGFWLGEKHGIPALLFNPALAMEIPGLQVPEMSPVSCPLRWVVLGETDDVVDPQASWTWLKQLPCDRASLSVAMIQGLGHQIDARTYEQSCRWAGLGRF